jgi:hypothetical protein
MNEDLSTAEQTRIDREGTGPNKTEPRRRRKTEDGCGAIDTRQHGSAEWREQHERVAQADERAADGREHAKHQCNATNSQRDGGNGHERVNVCRCDGEPGLHGDRYADSSAEHQEAEACPVAWIVQNASAP